MWSETKNSVQVEDGVALIMSIFAVMILLGLALVFVATAIFQQQSTGMARDYESSVHIAEAAADELIPFINDGVDDFVTTDSTGAPHTIAADLTPEAERAAVLAYAHDAEEDDLLTLAGGQGFAMRPIQDGEPAMVIYAVGWVPDRATGSRERVVKMRFDTLRYRPLVGLLTGGGLTFGGSASIEGDHGSVHANGPTESQPGNFSVEQNFTATGTVSSSICENVDGECYGGAAPRPVPNIDARSSYDLRGQAVGDWFDLCPPTATESPAIRAPSDDGPCQGDILEWDAGSESFNGWRYQNGEWRATHAHPGVYYVYQRNARIQGTTGSAMQPITVIAEEASGDAGGASGHIITTGNPKMESALSGLTLIADRDIVLGGTVVLEGLVGAHEQVDIPGNVQVNGAVVAEDARNTLGSLVTCASTTSCNSRVTGNMTITYDGTLEVPLSGVIRIIAWNES